ncbi:MAG: ComF family protein [Gallionellaceae bacterium]|nr:ComF family protein [Gallionellaceae bacterium]
MSHDGVWCAACDADLPRLIATHCPICSLPTIGGACGRCLKNPPSFNHTVAAFAYAFPIDKLIQAMKFSEHLTLVNRLADALTANVETQVDGIIAMPLHPLRLQERGFNQSQLLAQRIGKQLKIPLLNVCQRTRNTAPQSTLAWKERDKNMRAAFSCSVDLTGKHIANVDDVNNTGASIEELAHTLKQAGAAKVSAWVIARTLPH